MNAIHFSPMIRLLTTTLLTALMLAIVPTANAQEKDKHHAHEHEQEPPAENKGQDIELIDVTSAELMAEIKRRDASVVLVNVWAVWCEPCKDEMPHLIELAEAYRDRGVEIIIVSVDFETERPKTKAFLSQVGMTFPTYFRAGEDDETFISGVYKGWSGTLPATLMFDNDGTLFRFWEGDASKRFFEARILDALEGRTTAHPETLITSP